MGVSFSFPWPVFGKDPPFVPCTDAGTARAAPKRPLTAPFLFGGPSKASTGQGTRICARGRRASAGEHSWTVPGFRGLGPASRVSPRQERREHCVLHPRRGAEAGWHMAYRRGNLKSVTARAGCGALTVVCEIGSARSVWNFVGRPLQRASWLRPAFNETQHYRTRLRPQYFRTSDRVCRRRTSSL